MWSFLPVQVSKLNCICRLIVSAVLVVGSGFASAQAEEANADNKLRITSDSVVAELGDDSGSWTLEGKVRLEQTDVTLTADRMTVQREDRVVIRVVADGKPVAFEQTSPYAVVAKAEQITYELASKKLILTGEVEMHQDGNELRGARIEYDVEKGELVAESSETEEVDQIEFVLEDLN